MADNPGDLWRQPMGPCSVCGKQRYPNRRAAKGSSKVLYPGIRFEAYQCTSGFWHLGHLPESVIQGRRGRSVEGATDPYQ